MARTPQQVASEVLALLPSGWAMPQGDPNTFQAASFQPLANEWSLIEASMESYEVELDPGTAVNLVSDYQQVLGPNPYGWDALPLSTAQQQALLHNQWVDAPIICAGYFIAVAASIGMTITIQEFPRSACGVSRCGAAVLTPQPQHCVFKVFMPATDTWVSKCGAARCGVDGLGGYTPSVLEPFITQNAPLFTRPVFSYP